MNYEQVIPGRKGVVGSLARLKVKRFLPERIRPIGYLNYLAKRRTSGMVRLGPFSGMRYGSISQGSCFIPKLLGIYERELHHVIEGLIAAKPSLVIDLGAAEGYYAVGMALRLPEARVVAFEMEERGRNAITEIAALNGVSSRVEIRGKCEVGDLRSALNNAAKTVVICDVEGYEQQLLDPEAAADLLCCSLLVELHDFIVPGLSDLLEARFSSTHNIERIWQLDRDVSEFPWSTLGTRIMPREYLRWAVDEWRPVRMSWLHLSPKNM